MSEHKELEGTEQAPASARDEPRMPGRLPAHGLIDRILRVDQAGEYGATRIYEGQLAVLGNRSRTRSTAAEIRHMAEQEKRHLARFNALLNAHQVRPTLLSPLWHAAGYALGVGTALLGREAAMACTAAVEDAITEHYERQAASLGEDVPDIHTAIVESAGDEEEHLQTAYRSGAEAAPLQGLMTGLIKAGCKLAIRLSERI